LTNALLPERYRRAFISIFFGGLFMLGLVVLRDFSMPGDEEIQRVTGEVSLLYVFQQLPAPLRQRLLPARAAALIAQKGQSVQLRYYRDRDYGVAFEMPAAALEQLLRLHEPRQYFLLRHLLNFLVCYVGIAAFYTLGARRFSSWRVGLLGALLLVLSPRLFPDYFYNSKDAVFLALFTLAVAVAVPFIERPTWQRALAAALTGALAIDVRIMGVLVPAATVFFVSWWAIRGEYARGLRLPVVLVLYGVALAAWVVAGWPYLWEAPLGNFVAAWRNMSHFRGLGEILYQGRLVMDNALPWHYPLVWIGITVPLYCLLLAGVGGLAVGATLVRRRAHLYAGKEWQDLLFMGLGLAPLGAVIALHSVLYNGWRQLYFIYPMLLLLTLRGLVAAWRWQPSTSWPARYWQPALALLLGGALAVTAGQMVQMHPLQNLYFNALAPAQVEQKFETDYWSLGQRRGLEWVLAHDTRPRITFFSNRMYPTMLGHQLLPPAERARLVPVDSMAEADYFLTTTSFPSAEPALPLLATLRADGVPFLRIYAPRASPAPPAANSARE